MSAGKKKLLLVGGNGMLARAIATTAPSEYAITAVDLPAFNLADQEQVHSLTETLCPEIIINCAAYTDVDGCETEREKAELVNGVAVGTLAEAARRADAILVHISTDYVFDGTKKTPYAEDDQTGPQSAYGYSKLLGEQAIISSGLKRYFVVRTSWLYGPCGSNFVETIIRLSKERDEIGIVADQVGAPTYTRDLAESIFKLLALCASPQPPVPIYGVYHFSNEGFCSWFDFACEIVELSRKAGETLKVKTIKPIRTEEYPLPAKRPAYSVFLKEKYLQITGAKIPAWQESLAIYIEQRRLTTEK
jgi:dTDP-4-dehydrorhamnose reductase